MLNRVCLQGRLTKDPEIRNTANQTACASFTIACDRPFKNEATGKYDADFINCVAWRQTATFLGQYFHKGDQIVLAGRLQTRNYENNQGQRVYVTEVLVEEVNFCGGSSSKTTDAPAKQVAPTEGEELPFEV